MDGAFSSVPQPVDPDQLIETARAFLAAGNLPEALRSAEVARRLFNDSGQIVGELRACLLLAQIHHRREDLGSATLYTEEATDLLRRHTDLPFGVQAEVYLGLTRLAPDVGQLSQGLHFAQQALHFFDEGHDADGQFEAILLMGAIARQMGRFQHSATYLELAHSRFPATKQSAWAFAWMLNGEIHHHWYVGNFSVAATLGQRAVFHADQAVRGKYQIYQRLALANVLRAWGRYDDAKVVYLDAERVLTEIGFDLFRSWITINHGWLNVLTGDYISARRRIFQALETSDRGQAASYNVFLAGLYSLTERYTDAERLLRQSLHFYQTSGDELSIFAIRGHLAYLHLKQNHIELAEDEMSLGFTWAAQWNVDYFPHWWHPQIMALVCTHAFVADLHADLAERILVKRLGHQAIPALQPLLSHANAMTRRRAADALSLINVELVEQLTVEVDEHVHQVLAELFADGRLQMQHLPALIELLSTTRDGAANPVLLATFGLYLNGVDRRAIAERLARSEKTIRNYITLIYERFSLDGSEGPRRSRYQKLRRLAEEVGFVRSDGRQGSP